MSVPASNLRRMGPAIVLRGVVPALFLACVGALVGVGVVSWRRLTPLRKGRDRPTAPPLLIAGGSRTSLATVVPGVAGMAAAAWGGVGLGLRVAHILLAGGGLLVAVSGLMARVVWVEVAPAGVVIRYSRRRPFVLSWRDLRGLRPPRWPLGGWRLIGDSGSRTLMPSDLLGHEWVLAAVIDRAGLRFDEGAWI